MPEVDRRTNRVLITCALVALLLVSWMATVSAGPTTTYFRTPLVMGTGADPDITTYNGRYYMLYNGDHNGSAVRMRTATSLSGLADATDVMVWSPPPSMPDICCHVGWGGYLFQWGGRWYIYEQGDNGDPIQARSFVLESAGSDPKGPYTFKSYFPGVVGNVGYAAGPGLVGSQLYTFETYQGGIYIAKASNPWTLTTGWNLIAQAPSGSPWECAGGSCINEGSSIRVRGGLVFDIFSAGGYGSPDYCVGMLNASATADLTLQSNWTKSSGCVFSRNDAVGAYGPGSMTWFTSPDGTQDWVSYHVKKTTNVDWSGADRRLEAKQVVWNPDGTPNFGAPTGLNTTWGLPSGDPGTINSAPSASTWGSDNVNLYARGSDNQVYFRRWDPIGGWTAWMSIGAPSPSAVLAPTSNSRTTNISDVFAVGGDGNLYQRFWQNSTWSPWYTFGTPNNQDATSSPSLATWGVDRYSIYVRSVGGDIWERWWSSGTGWSGWQSLGQPAGGAQSSPAAVSRATNYVDVFVRGAGNDVYTKYWDGTSWNGWFDMGQPGGGAISAPAVCSWGSDRLSLYVVGADGNVYEKYWSSGAGWSAWQSMGAPAVGASSSPTATSRMFNYTDLFVRGNDGRIYTKWWNGSVWSAWTDMGAP